jgi:prepilin-type N-terminal cleavage/methylation domain-containing protein
VSAPDRGEDGFSIIEVMITSALLLLILTAALSALVSVQRTSDFSTRRGQTQDDVRAAMDQLTKDLRQLTRFRTSFLASSGCNQVDTSGSGPSFQGCELDFDAFTPANPDQAVRVHWWTSAGTLWRETYLPDGSSAGRSAVLSAMTTPGGAVPQVFQCDVLQGSDTVTGAATPWEVTVTLTVDLAQPGGTYSVQGQAQLRNLQIPQPTA